MGYSSFACSDWSVFIHKEINIIYSFIYYHILRRLHITRNDISIIYENLISLGISLAISLGIYVGWLGVFLVKSNQCFYAKEKRIAFCRYYDVECSIHEKSLGLLDDDSENPCLFCIYRQAFYLINKKNDFYCFLTY